MEGIEKLQAQVLELNDYNVSTIFDYLKSRTDLYEKFNNKEKSIQGMYDFICNKARKKTKNGVAMVNDNVVYLWAVTYFGQSNEELGIIQKNTISKITKTTKNSNVNESKKDINNNKSETNQVSIFEEGKK